MATKIKNKGNKAMGVKPTRLASHLAKFPFLSKEARPMGRQAFDYYEHRQEKAEEYASLMLASVAVAAVLILVALIMKGVANV
jgi:hypothetical protein